MHQVYIIYNEEANDLEENKRESFTLGTKKGVVDIEDSHFLIHIFLQENQIIQPKIIIWFSSFYFSLQYIFMKSLSLCVTL